jgi:hypothetical protein
LSTKALAGLSKTPAIKKNFIFSKTLSIDKSKPYSKSLSCINIGFKNV